MNESTTNTFHKDLKSYMDELATDVYLLSKSFPKEEMFGITSQLRRAALSIILNYIEGYGRNRRTYLKSFLGISYGSLKETKYLIYFSHKLGYLADKDFKKLKLLTENIGKMLWGILKNL